MKKLILITLFIYAAGCAFAQDRTENKNVSIIVDVEGGYGAGKGINTLTQLGSGLHLVFKNNVAIGVQGQFGFFGGLKKPNALSTYSSQSLVFGKVSPIGKNWSVYPFIGIGRYNAVETTDVPDTVLNEITGLFGSDAERFTTQAVSDLVIPFGIKLYRSKKKFAGFYVGANGFYSFNGSYGLFGNVGLAFGGRKRVPLEQPLSIKPDFAVYTGPSWIGDKSVFGLNHGLDVNFFIRENVFVGFGGEWMSVLNKRDQLAIIHNPVGGKSANVKLGVKTDVSEKMSLLISTGLNIQSLTKTTNKRVEATLVDEVTQGLGGALGIPTEEKVEYTTEDVTNAGFLFEAMFRKQLGTTPFSLMFGPKFSVSKESTYSLKLGIGYSIR